MTRPTPGMVTDAQASEWRTLCDETDRQFGRPSKVVFVSDDLRALLAERETHLGLLCLLDVELSVSSNLGIQQLLDRTLRRVTKPEHYAHIPKAQEWLEEEAGRES